jgi:hypothetical protein
MELIVKGDGIDPPWQFNSQGSTLQLNPNQKRSMVMADFPLIE